MLLFICMLSVCIAASSVLSLFLLSFSSPHPRAPIPLSVCLRLSVCLSVTTIFQPHCASVALTAFFFWLYGLFCLLLYCMSRCNAVFFCFYFY
uniref:Putative secreted peptide n=1 Tax=Anopheles braziliensis TaxID=58242 RepID=A0A2M3ZMU5_9DIPT